MTNKYDLAGYIRRGVHGSKILDHPAGSRFADLNGCLKINLSRDWIGRTLYFKAAAFNKDRSQQNSLAECVTYTYVRVGGPVADTGDSYID